MKIVTVIGARPQFIKAAAASRVIRRRHQEILIHTGQHYDDNMSAVFFRELDIPAPDEHLNCGGGSHAEQTGAMLVAIERVLQRERPDLMLVYGDTNSTLAGALAAAKLHIRIAHVEAGLRSFNRGMPEEVNRVLTDHLSALLFCPSAVSQAHLKAEGITSGVHVIGDVMADALLNAVARSAGSTVLGANGLKPGAYALMTIHRAENTDDPQRLASILGAIQDLGRAILLPLHPRTRKAIQRHGLAIPGNVTVVEPLGYLDLVRALKDAELLLTDSGGMQKEAYWLGVPCVTLREETEWTETVQTGWNRLAGTARDRIVDLCRKAGRPARRPDLYGGDGHASERLAAAIDTP